MYKVKWSNRISSKLGICSTIVDLVSTGKTLKENNLGESNLVINYIKTNY